MVENVFNTAFVYFYCQYVNMLRVYVSSCSLELSYPPIVQTDVTDLQRDLYFSAPPRGDWIRNAGTPILTSLPAAEELNQLL